MDESTNGRHADGLVAAIGNTLLIRLRRASEATGCTILGKAEFMNPGGSVKDRAGLGIARGVAAAAALVLLPGPARAAPCQTADKPVYVGGVVGFSSLGDPAATAQLRATGRVGLYIHFSALPPALKTGRLAPVYDAFRGTGNGVAEFGDTFMSNPDFVNGQFRTFFTGLGQAPWAALVNAVDNFVGATPQTVAAWQAQAATARTLGIRLLLPISAPNDNYDVDDDPGTHPHWALLRDVASAMGGVAIDAPPAYFLHNNARAPQYRRWLVQFMHWMAKQGTAEQGTAEQGVAGRGMRVFWIISPDTSGTEFLADTQSMVAYLSDHKALPNYWIVENYDSYSTLRDAEVTAGGSGYTRATVRVSPPAAPWGTQAVATARLERGAVAGVDIIDPGSGYLSASLTVEGDGAGGAARVQVVPRQGARPAGTLVPGDARKPNPNVVGREDLAQSVANVALWVARNAPVRPLPPGTPVLSGTGTGTCGP